MRGNIVENQVGKRSPLELRFGPNQEQNVTISPRRARVVEVVLRPRYSTLRIVDDPNLWPRLGEDEEVFRVDLSARFGVPLPHQVTQRSSRDLGGIVPAGESHQHDRIAKVGAIQFKQLIHVRSPFSARSLVEYATASYS